MGFNPLNLLKGAAKAIGEIAGVDLSSILGMKEEDLSPEQRALLASHEVALRELAFKELETEINAKVDLMKTEIKSEDPYVRRARPTGLYISYICSLALVGAVVAGVDVDPTAILTLLGPLMGFSGWYSYNRSQDKKNGRN
jgi:hypothetical protein